MLFLLACGRMSSSVSETKDIVTDLEQNERGSGLKQIYFLDGKLIIRKDCPDEVPIYTRITCTGRMQMMEYETFKVALDNGLSQSVSDLAKRASQLSAHLAELRKQLQRTEQEIAKIESEAGPMAAQLRSLRLKLSKLELWIEEGQKQIAAINEDLRRTRNSDLEEQREAILNEIQKLETFVREVNDQLNDIISQVGAVDAKLDALRQDFDRVDALVGQVQAQLKRVQEDLASAKSDLEIYEHTLTKLTNSAIAYQVNTDTTWYEAERKFVRRFDAIFAR
jgi:chromosome segregation ATPase